MHENRWQRHGDIVTHNNWLFDRFSEGPGPDPNDFASICNNNEVFHLTTYLYC